MTTEGAVSVSATPGRRRGERQAAHPSALLPPSIASPAQNPDQPGPAQAGAPLAPHTTFSSFFTALSAISRGKDSHRQQKAFPWQDRSYFSHIAQHFPKEHRGFWHRYT